ncbi:hypothetical protein TNCV_3694011 [Trichonephila clavipes]|nr:hypothetical protein TNCV_3694011 [Trichonephila clavipes]
MQRNLFGRLLGTSMTNKVDIEKVLGFPLTQIPSSMCHADSSICKTDKAQLIEVFEKKVSKDDQEKQLYVKDRLFLSNRKLNSSQILKEWTLTSNVSVCPKTVRGRLLEIGLHGCKARPKPLPTEFQRKRQLTWAGEHSLWTIKDWEKVIFSDESQFCISGNQSSAYVRRHTHEEFSS